MLLALEHLFLLDLILAGNKDSYKSLDAFEIQHSGAFIFGWIFIIHAGFKDNYKSFNEFDVCPLLTSNYRVSCS